MPQLNASLRLLFPCDDKDASQRFYQQVFGGATSSGSRRSSFEMGTVSADLLKQSMLAELLEETTAPVLMLEVTDVETAIASLQDAGGTLLRAATATPLGLTAVMRDPDGRSVLVVKPHSAVLGE